MVDRSSQDVHVTEDLYPVGSIETSSDSLKHCTLNNILALAPTYTVAVSRTNLAQL